MWGLFLPNYLDWKMGKNDFLFTKANEWQQQIQFLPRDKVNECCSSEVKITLKHYGTFGWAVRARPSTIVRSVLGKRLHPPCCLSQALKEPEGSWLQLPWRAEFFPILAMADVCKQGWLLLLNLKVGANKKKKTVRKSKTEVEILGSQSRRSDRSQGPAL